MDKKLPGVFASKIEKKLNNNESMHYTSSKDIVEDKKNKINNNNQVNLSKKNIKDKIKEIFSSTEYIYKADVEIIIKDKKVTKRIIGRNNHNLITIDNELIPIYDIVDINIVKE